MLCHPPVVRVCRRRNLGGARASWPPRLPVKGAAVAHPCASLARFI